MPTGKKLETQPSIQTCGFSPHKYPRFGRQALSALSHSHYCLSSQCNMTLPMSVCQQKVATLGSVTTVLCTGCGGDEMARW